MTNELRKSRLGGSYLLQRSQSAGPQFHYKTVASTTRPPSRQESNVLFLDENCPVHGSQEISNISENDHFQQQPIHNNQQNMNDLYTTTTKPFTNNPPLPNTQRDVVGNNLQFPSSAQANKWNKIDNNQLSALIIRRDALKQNLTTPYRANSGLPKMRYGRIGGNWRHIKQTNTYSNANLLFIDGTVRVDDSVKYPIPSFGYPPLSRSQYNFQSGSNQDLSSTPTKSVEVMTWSATDELNRRPSLSRYSNRYERHAKEGFAYWPTDIEYKKPRCNSNATGTYKTWLGLSDAVLKL